MKSNQSNPFSTRFVAPGTIEWIVNTCDPQLVFERWLQHGRRGAIIGPHGSGKSTLLEFLIPFVGPVTFRRDPLGTFSPEVGASYFRQATSNDSLSPDSNQSVVWLQLRKTSPPSMPIPWEQLHLGSTLVIDGYEQLGFLARGLILLKTQQRGIGLIVTSHRNTWLPTLCKLSVNAELAKKITELLVRDVPSFKVPSKVELDKALHRKHGNLREVLMEMYDEFEEQSR